MTEGVSLRGVSDTRGSWVYLCGRRTSRRPRRKLFLFPMRVVSKMRGGDIGRKLLWGVTVQVPAVFAQKSLLYP